MAFAKQFAFNYHDGRLISAQVGPRHEVTLVVLLDPVWNDGREKECRVRLSAIQNFDEVARFVHSLKAPAHADAVVDDVTRLAWTPEGNVQLELARNGFLEVHRPKVQEI
jgi:hypothetical protein